MPSHDVSSEQPQNAEKWIKTLSEKEREEILGVGKYTLYKRGVITLKDLAGQKGKGATLKELSKKHSKNSL